MSRARSRVGVVDEALTFTEGSVIGKHAVSLNDGGQQAEPGAHSRTSCSFRSDVVSEDCHPCLSYRYLQSLLEGEIFSLIPASRFR